MSVEFVVLVRQLRKAQKLFIKSQMTVIVEDTGEAVQIKPPVKKSMAGLKFSVK